MNENWQQPKSREEVVDDAIATFEPRYGRKLTREEGEEIVDNLGGIMGLLLQWHREDQEAEKNGHQKPVQPE